MAFTVGDGPDRGVWVRDLAAGRTFLASRADGPAGEPAERRVPYRPRSTRTGRVSCSMSNATNLGDGDGDNLAGHPRARPGQRADDPREPRSGGAKGDGESGLADINADGNTRGVRERTRPTSADGDTDVQPDIHLRDLAAETTTPA